MTAPFIIRQNGTIEDRATGWISGQWWFRSGTGPSAGWFASCPRHHDHGAFWTRRFAVSEAYACAVNGAA